MTIETENTAPIRVALVTGGHPFDVPALHNLFRSLTRVDFYPQHMEDFAADVGSVRDTYDVVVFYHMLKETPTGDETWYAQPIKAAVESLGDTPQGLLLLHHAIVAYPEWEVWRNLSGLDPRTFQGYSIGEDVPVRVASSGHPILHGLEDWVMQDETYAMDDPLDAEDVLLTTSHPKSMKVLAWTRRHRRAPVCCIQPGHGGHAFGHPAFRRLVGQTIDWLAMQSRIEREVDRNA
ncbi:MAG: ThuA domain-containing protein [Candidatus Hydrogenedentes bacterium]|nr:ThuA domain-containing protein [Candidatus Hydrogenedentota bacterium]